MLLVAAPASSAAADGPQLALPKPLLRGQVTELASSGLQVGTSYTLSLDHALFSPSQTSSLTFTATSSGVVNQAIRLPATDPVTHFMATLTAAGDPSVLASLDIPVAPPTLGVGGACPGWHTTLLGFGYLVGSYAIQTGSGVSVDSSPVQTDPNGVLDAALTLDDNVTGDFTVTVTPVGSNTPVLSSTVPMRKPTVFVLFDDPWHGTVDGFCFKPHEQVALSSSTDLDMPASVPADENGEISPLVKITNRPDQRFNPPITVTFTGQSSHQQATLSVSNIARGALLPGQLLQGHDFNAVLASSAPAYDLEPNACRAPIWHQTPSGSRSVSWTALPVTSGLVGQVDCSLLMQTDGNAVLRSPTGQPTWSSNTHVTGSHLQLTNAGSLQVVSPIGTVLWDSSIAPSRVSISSSRAGSAVFINGLVQQRAPTAQLVRGSHRTVYLQRYLNGHWQNMLARTTDSNGQLAVGFIQPTVLPYRLLLLPTATASGATSGITAR